MRLIVCAMLAIGLLAAQEKPTEPPKEESSDPYGAEVIAVKTLSGDSFNRVATLLRPFGVKYQADERLRTIVVYGPKNVVAQMRKVVEQLDRPGSEAAIGKNVEGTIAFLKCSTKASSGAASLPSDLESVARQLKTATFCKDVELWDSLPIHLQEGKEAKFDLARSANLPDTTAFTTVRVYMTPEAVTRKDTGRYVRFSRINIGFRFPYAASPTQFQFMEMLLETAGDFKEGQKTVLGKISGTENDTAIFAVVTLKVLD